LLIDTGLIVVSTSKTFGIAHQQMAQMIRTLVHPAPVIAVHMSKEGEDPPQDTDLHYAGPQDFDTAARQIIDELKRRGVFADVDGARPRFQYSI
jgi:bifunctional enzyme CysN/CysC